MTAIEAATQKKDGLQAIFFAAGICDFLSAKSRDRIKALLADKGLKVPKTIATELASRTFVSSFFGLRGLDLVRKKSIIPSQNEQQKRTSSPGRD